MELLIIRHAVAASRRAFARTGRPDAERPLTAEGRRRFRASLRGLRRAAPDIDVIATSPYARARQTCELVVRAFPRASIIKLPSLAHRGSDRSTVRWLSSLGKDRAAAIVGHEPDLGRLIGRLAGTKRPPIRLKKGGAALIEFNGRARRGAGRLVWALTPRILRHTR